MHPLRSVGMNLNNLVFSILLVVAIGILVLAAY